MRCRVRDLRPVELYQLLIISTKARPFREENKAYNSLVDSYSKLIGSKSFNAVQWFFSNVSRSLRNGHKGLKVRLRAEYWSGNVAGIGYRKVKEVIEWFEYNDYITVYLGNSDYRAEWKSYPTIVKFNQKLIDLLDMEKVRLFVPEERLKSTLLVKDRSTKEELAFETTEETVKMEAEMVKYNDSFRDVLIEFNGQEVPTLVYQPRS